MVTSLLKSFSAASRSGVSGTTGDRAQVRG
jgi:hypothetical protein